MVIVNACPLCISAEESVDHLMLNCTMAHQICTTILNSFGCSWVLPRSIVELFEAWRFQIRTSKGKAMSRLSFLVTIWAIWKERNCRCFEGSSSSLADVVDEARLNVVTWISILPAFRGLSTDIIMLNWKDVAFS